MRKVVCIVMALALGVTAASPVFAAEKQPKIKSEVVMKVGKEVHMFHSGTADVKKEVCLNDVIPVYRETPTGGHTTSKVVGKVKVLAYEGEHYIKGKVVEGEVKVGDIVKKETAACLIQPAK